MSYRRFQLSLILMALFVCVSPMARSAGSSFTIAPPPAWALPAAAAPPQENAAGDAGNGIKYLLVDNQIRVNGKAKEHYFRRIKKVISVAKLQDASQLELEFEPSYQKLIIHYIRIQRGAQVIDALKPREIKIIQQESELDQRLYNGTLTAVAFLNDVRAGDTIDYAYSINGENPILGGRFADSFWLATTVPIEQLRCRLLWPADRALQLRNQGIEAQPVNRLNGPEREYVWERNQVPAIDIEDGTPDWFNPIPRVQLSEFASWEEVSRWAVPLYAVNRSLSPELTKQIEQWRAELQQPEARFLAALRFVQDEVRYLGIELGPHSHLPHSPASVFARRFGDCKDKALLLTTMLNALEIEAYPALVNTQTRHKLTDWQPSPYSFDHVIVQTKLAGKTYWVDATASLQRGGLDQLYNPDYGRALVVREGSRELEEIPMPPNAVPSTTIKEVYTADSFDLPAALEVTTTYRGEDAEGMRHTLAQQSLAELGKSYLNYYAENDPAITADGLPKVADDVQTNTIVVTEKYRIPNFWRDQTRDFLAARIYRELDKPKISRRSMPLGVAHPVNIEETIELRLADGFRIANGSGTIEDEAIHFQYRHEFRNKILKLNYRFQSRRDYVPVEQVTKHLETLDKIQQVINYRITRGTETAQATSKLGNVVLGSLCLLSGVALVVFGIVKGLNRWRAPQGQQRQHEFIKRQKLAPGEGPEAAIRLPAAEDLHQHIQSFRCQCGNLYHQPGAPLRPESLVFDGRRLVVVQLKCEQCGHRRDLYFDRSGEPEADKQGYPNFTET